MSTFKVDQDDVVLGILRTLLNDPEEYTPLKILADRLDEMERPVEAQKFREWHPASPTPPPPMKREVIDLVRKGQLSPVFQILWIPPWHLEVWANLIALLSDQQTDWTSSPAITRGSGHTYKNIYTVGDRERFHYWCRYLGPWLWHHWKIEVIREGITVRQKDMEEFEYWRSYHTSVKSS